MAEWDSWCWAVVHFVELVACSRCYRHDRQNDTHFGLHHLAGLGHGDVRPVCVECARTDVERHESVRGWLDACQQIVDEADGDAPLPCGCHCLPPLACAAARAHANPFAPWDGPVCDCVCHSGSVVVDAGKGQGE